MAEIGKLHFAGYHGTTINNARGIEQNGFRGNSGPIYFAPLDNLGFAQCHGRRCAEEYGDSQFGVVMASFPPRKQNLTLYVDPMDFPELLKDLGKHVTSVSCLYINKLDDVDLKVLEKLIAASFKRAKEKYA